MSLDIDVPMPVYRHRLAIGPLILPRVRWVMVGFAFAATVINYLDRQTLSVVAPALREEF